MRDVQVLGEKREKNKKNNMNYLESKITEKGTIYMLTLTISLPWRAEI